MNDEVVRYREYKTIRKNYHSHYFDVLIDDLSIVNTVMKQKMLELNGEDYLIFTNKESKPIAIVYCKK